MTPFASLAAQWAESRALDCVEDNLTGGGAVFDIAHQYRYLLWRRWNTAQPMLGFIMLNPSRANAGADDPTSTRCNNRAISLGYGGVLVANLFAYRATDPRQMKMMNDPVGRWNDDAIRFALAQAGMVIAAWGQDGRHRDRQLDVIAIAQEHKVRLHHLGLTKDGLPRHPLYISRDMYPVAWEMAA